MSNLQFYWLGFALIVLGGILISTVLPNRWWVQALLMGALSLVLTIWGHVAP